MYGTEFDWKVFEQGMKMHMMSHVKVCPSTILLAEFEVLAIE